MAQENIVNLSLWIIRKGKKYLYEQIGSFILLFLCISLTLFSGFIIRKLIDFGILAKDFNMLFIYSFAYLMVLVFLFVFNVGKDYIICRITSFLVNDLRKDIFQALRRIDYRKLHQKFFTEKILTTINNDINLVASYYTQTIIQTFVNFIYVVITVVILLLNDMYTLLISLLFAVIICCIVFKFYGKIAKQSIKNRKAIEALQGLSQEFLFFMKQVIFFNNPEVVDQTVKIVVDNVAHENLWTTFLVKLNNQIVKYVGQIPHVMIYFYGGYLILNNNMNFSLGKTISLVFYVEMFMMAIETIASNIANASNAEISLRELIDALNVAYLQPVDKEIVGLLKSSELSVIQMEHSSIAFDNKVLFNDLNWRFLKEKINFICGINGSGKTSIVFSLLGLYPLAQGTIKFNDLPLMYPKTYGLDVFFSCAFQDKQCLDFLSIEQYLEQVKNHELFEVVVSDLELSFDRFKENHLSQLSGGERQKISLLSAICTNRPIIILDEPSNHLDKSAKNGLCNILKLLNGKKIVIIITHDKELLNVSPNNVLEL